MDVGALQRRVVALKRQLSDEQSYPGIPVGVLRTEY